jgi:hypothetical protein
MPDQFQRLHFVTKKEQLHLDSRFEEELNSVAFKKALKI